MDARRMGKVHFAAIETDMSVKHGGYPTVDIDTEPISDASNGKVLDSLRLLAAAPAVDAIDRGIVDSGPTYRVHRIPRRSHGISTAFPDGIDDKTPTRGYTAATKC